MACKLIALLSITACCFLSCSQNTTHTIGASSVVHEGSGVDEITFGKINSAFLKDYFKLPYDSVKYGTYSVAIGYPQFGAYFYYLQGDDSARIFAMRFDSTFKGKASMGFDLHLMSIKDMIRIYGQPRWQEIDHMMYAHYDGLGIYFATIPKTDPEPDFYADVTEDDEEGDSLADRNEQLYRDSVYSPSRIVEITVGPPGTSF